jgi:flagellin
MVEQSNMMQRMRELAVQAASDTVTTDQKAYLNAEFQNLRTEIDRIGSTTQWNGANLLDKSAATNTGVYTFQIGAQMATGNTVTVTIDKASTDGGIYAAISLATVADISSTATASAAIGALNTSLTAANNQRATIGAKINQLNYAADNLSNISMNTAASRSRIEDTDYAQASTELARTQIIQQAATAMLAQANQSPQSVLALLK